jgi:hypothetical protein
LQTLPSVQGAPLETGLLVHPKIGSQRSVVQALLSLQLRAPLAAQMALWHVSMPLQMLPSEHEVPLKAGVTVHPDSG